MRVAEPGRASANVSWATQGAVALSSAEAELNATVKMISETLGVRNLYGAFEVEKPIIVHTDSSACCGILHREGCGKVKHLETRQLWTQAYVSSKIVDVRKIPREHNISDCLTHHWSAVDGARHFQNAGLRFAQ